jgi:predicted nucleotidyltransferase
VARGDETDKSDIDLLVATGDKTSPWFPGGLVIELEKIIGRKVDVVTEKGINPRIREQVMKEASLL